MAILKILQIVSFFLLSFGVAHADWTLDMENSKLSYGSIKKNSIGESNHFKSLEGRITDKGEITLLIDLTSVETWVDIRNGRMKEFFFQTAEFPVATLRGQVDMAKLNDLKVGALRTVGVTFDFDLHGLKQAIVAELVIMPLAENSVVIVPDGIIFLNVENFNLLPGLKKLQNLAKLPSISSSVPINFHLTFNRIP